MRCKKVKKKKLLTKINEIFSNPHLVEGTLGGPSGATRGCGRLWGAAGYHGVSQGTAGNLGASGASGPRNLQESQGATRDCVSHGGLWGLWAVIRGHE
jgi:hypothetical protein